MATIINTSDYPAGADLPGPQKQIYNALDCCVTREVADKLLPQMESASTSYQFSRAMQGPLMEMMLRGILVDPWAKATAVRELEQSLAKIDTQLGRIAFAAWERELNYNSPKQLQEFFYSHMRLPEIYVNFKGQRRVSTNREALEKLDNYLYAKPIVSHILAARDLGKKLSVLRSGIDFDGRMRTSYNIGGTITGRLSSSSNAFGGGTNLQNITEWLRRIFIAEPGRKLAYLDLEQAESRVVAYLSGDPNYIHACESGDLHTSVAQMVWPSAVTDRASADTPFYRHFTYRDLAKRGGHACNYMISAFTLAKHLRLPVKVAEEFQRAYFGAFPGIRRWHTKTAGELQTQGHLTTPLGRKCHFLDRLWDDSTLRVAIAYRPQSTVGELLNFGLYEAWRTAPPGLWFLAQIHDAILISYPEEHEAEAISHCATSMMQPIEVNGKHMMIPVEAKSGWNWAGEDPSRRTWDDGNPDGLRKWRGRDERVRTNNPEIGALDRRLSG